MTVIVTDGVSMACDGMIAHRETIVDLSAKKIPRLKDGSLCGMSGDTLTGNMVANWLDTVPRKRGPFPSSDNTTVLLLRPNGALEMYCGKSLGEPLPVKPPYAIGSGMDFALAAMDMGATLAQAVAVAIKRNPYCGGDIQIEALHP